MPIYVAIPAAGHVRDTGSTETLQSPLLRIVGGRVFLHMILDRLVSSGLLLAEVRIGVTSADIEQVSYLVNAHGSQLKVQVVACDNTNSGSQTLQRLLTGVPAKAKVLVHLGDTLVDMDWSCISEFSSGLGVTAATMELDRLSLVQYPINQNREGHEVRGLVGIYWFSLDQAHLQLSNDAALEDFVLFSEKEPLLEEVHNWIDADYSDRLDSANLTFESRNFNSVQRIPGTNLLEKASSNFEKLRREYDFVSALEPQAASLFPAMRKFELVENFGSLLMDYWPLPNLSDLYCFQNLSPHFWDSLMGHITDLLPILHGKAQPDHEGSFEWAYFEKTSERLRELEEASSWFESFSRATEINTIFCESPDSILLRARVALQNVAAEISRVHGDFCFSNILVDSNSMMVKLIDARGGFKVEGSEGPASYDLAKLAHSALGDYDLILKGFFRKSSLDGVHTFDIVYPPQHASMREAFVSSIEALGKDMEVLRLLSALILMSIPPLHLENSERAQMFLLKGRFDATIALRALERRAKDE